MIGTSIMRELIEKSPEFHGTHLINVGGTKDYVNQGASQQIVLSQIS